MATWKRALSVRHYYSGSVVRPWEAGSVASRNPDDSANRAKATATRIRLVWRAARLIFRRKTRQSHRAAATLEGLATECRGGFAGLTLILDILKIARVTETA